MQSNIELEEYFYVYNITIVNNSDKTVQLLSRKWIIHDSNGESRYVEGEGVVGQQPILGAGQTYEYYSGLLLRTGFGKMKGSYVFTTLPDFEEFEAEVPEFHLALPWVMN